jgi:membrane protein
MELPFALPAWLRLLRHVGRRIGSDRSSLVAAGCAFYGTLALFPALSMLVSLYGLAFDPKSVAVQLGLIEGLLPPDAFGLIARQVTALIAQPPRTLGLSLLVGLGMTLWSASAATKALLSALNLVHGYAESRGMLRFNAMALGMTLATMLGAVLAVALLVALPVASTALGLPAGAQQLVHLASFGVMLVFVALALAFLYRFGPARRPLLILPGAFAGTLVWIIASVVFSLLVTNVMGLSATYGPLAAVAAMMLWFWISAYVVLVGAELNAALALAGG